MNSSTNNNPISPEPDGELIPASEPHPHPTQAIGIATHRNSAFG
ncbi:MAG: hypothetical protein ACKVI3_09745 [Verrucomicrobiia bacterium]